MATLNPGNYSGSPSAADPDNTLTVGSRGSQDLCFGGGIPEILFYDRDLDDTELNELENYIRNKYGFL